jgi:hypothetical protein
MSALTAVSLLTDLLQVASSLMNQANAISAVIKKAQDENRAITPEEWAQIDGDQIKARTAAIAAVANLS